METSRRAERSRNGASQSRCRRPRRRQRERKGATGDAVAECSEPVGVQGFPTSPTRAAWSDRRSGRGMPRASRGAGVPDVANASGMERPAPRSRNAASQSRCRGRRRRQRERNGATGDAVAECSELVGVQGSPTSPTRAAWSDRRSGRGMERASRGAGVPDDQERKRTGPGGPPGLQNRLLPALSGRAGFDSQALPPQQESVARFPEAADGSSRRSPTYPKHVARRRIFVAVVTSRWLSADTSYSSERNPFVSLKSANTVSAPLARS